MIIGERLKGFLKYHNISAKSFAEMIGVTEGMVYKYYKMDNVDSQTIEKWANILRIPIMTFLDDNTYERAFISSFFPVALFSAFILETAHSHMFLEKCQPYRERYSVMPEGKIS